MTEKKSGSPYFKYDNPSDQGRVGIIPKGKWFQDYYNRETNVIRVEELVSYKQVKAEDDRHDD
jgi:hypothetical protein